MTIDRDVPRRPRILVVEDNNLNADMLSRRLVRAGFEVLAAVDGVQAVAQAVQECPALILMDISLPEIDGWEATRRLKNTAATSAIPIIALSANVMAGVRERSLSMGCQEFEPKPIDFASLLAKIAALLPNA